MDIRVVSGEHVSLEDRMYYQDYGCLLVRGLYSKDDIGAARRVVEEAFEQPDQVKRLGDRKYLSIVSQFSQSPEEWFLFKQINLHRVCQMVTGWDKLCWEESTGTLVVSWPQEKDWTGMHLDFQGSGHQIAQGESKVYGLIYLDDANDADCGRTKVVLGSHEIVREHLLLHPDDPRNEMLYDDVSFFGFGDQIPVNAQAGDVLLFDYLLAHSSGGHRRNTPRIVLRVGFHNGVGLLTDKTISVPD